MPSVLRRLQAGAGIARRDPLAHPQPLALALTFAIGPHAIALVRATDGCAKPWALTVGAILKQ